MFPPHPRLRASCPKTVPRMAARVRPPGSSAARSLPASCLRSLRARGYGHPCPPPRARAAPDPGGLPFGSFSMPSRLIRLPPGTPLARSLRRGPPAFGHYARRLRHSVARRGLPLRGPFRRVPSVAFGSLGSLGLSLPPGSRVRRFRSVPFAGPPQLRSARGVPGGSPRRPVYGRGTLASLAVGLPVRQGCGPASRALNARLRSLWPVGPLRVPCTLGFARCSQWARFACPERSASLAVARGPVVRPCTLGFARWMPCGSLRSPPSGGLLAPQTPSASSPLPRMNHPLATGPPAYYHRSTGVAGRYRRL